MKSFFLCFTFMTLTCQTNEFFYYKQALSLVLNSNEFKKYEVKDEDYNVSSEIISFSNYSNIFSEELGVDDLLIIPSVIIKNEKELLKLNIRKCSKVKIFFSEQKNNIFFVEVFIYKKKALKYEKMPVFGTSNIYMFKIQNEITSLVAVKGMNYN